MCFQANKSSETEQKSLYLMRERKYFMYIFETGIPPTNTKS